MDKIFIPVHSMVDVITNSSTELFVLDTNKSLKTIKEILQEAIDLHNSSMGTNLKFEDVFDDPYIGEAPLGGWEDFYTSKIIGGVVLKGASDNSIPFWMFDFIENIFGWRTERFHLG